jgi:hypothetical protein
MVCDRRRKRRGLCACCVCMLPRPPAVLLLSAFPFIAFIFAPRENPPSHQCRAHALAKLNTRQAALYLEVEIYTRAYQKKTSILTREAPRRRRKKTQSDGIRGAWRER